MKPKILLLIAATCGATLAVSAQPRIGISLRIGVPPPIIVRQEPPRPVVVEYEAAPAPSPGPRYVWVRSHHRWMDGHWVRVQGGWVVPPQPNAVWVEGRWDAPTQSWTEEHWEVAQPVNYETPAMPPPQGYAPPEAYAPPGPPQSRDRGDYDGDRRGATAEIFFRSAPPPLREERMSERPSRQHMWIAGYWTANHGRHEWVSGHWEVPPRERSTWIAPHWERRDDYVLVQGYWR
jgi:hypothetical protein